MVTVRAQNNPAAATNNAGNAAGQTPADRFIAEAMRFKGQPYLWGGGHSGFMSGPGRVDCSGLVTQAAHLAGLNLSGTADMQQRMGHKISMSDLKPGDLVFCGTPAHHVGIYVGNGLVLNAPHTGDVVKLSPVSYFDNAVRVFDQAGQPIAATQPDTGSPANTSGGDPSTGPDASNLGGGGRSSNLSLPSGGMSDADRMLQRAREDSQAEEQQRQARAAQAAGQTPPPAQASPTAGGPGPGAGGAVNSGLQNVDSTSTGGLDDIMGKLEALGISKDDLQAMSQKYGVPLKMILAVIKQESGGDPNAQSGAGAQGLMQLMPDTAKGLGVNNAFDPKQNVEGGVKLLAQNLQRYGGDTSKALAAYNAGAGNVDKYGGVPPFAETQNYVKNITAMMNA